MEGYSGDHQGASFWKKSSQAVPGRPSPKREMAHRHHQGASGAASFEDFQNSVSDAWDLGDDEFYVASDVRISRRMAQSTALSVINSHRHSMNEGSTKDDYFCEDPSLSHEKCAEAMQRLASQRDLPSPQRRSRSGSPPMVGACNRNVPGRPRALRSSAGLQSKQMSDRDCAKVDKFRVLLEVQNADLDDLRHLSWSGVPSLVRGTAWRLLSGYLPANMERRQQVLDRKREEYWNFVSQYYDSRLEDSHEDTFRQIHIDIPRMSPLIALFQQIAVQEMFERVLFIWAIRHPASGYVQGMNDLVTPFFVVFLEEVLPSGEELEIYDVSQLPQEQRDNIEADSFWCMSKFLDSIQDNYTFAQPGIQQKVNQLKELVCRVDVPLHRHLQSHEVDYLQFSFRWMNNLLMRELPLRCTIRLWDTYLSEPDGFGAFHLYVCAAFLLNWRKELLRQRDFQGLMLFLQNLPTHNWSDSDVSLMVAEAFRLKYMFADAPNHLQGGSSKTSAAAR